MFVIVASSAKSDIESKGCVCLTKVDKIETYFDTTRIKFASLEAKNDAKYELEGADVNYEFVTPLTLEFKQTQIIAIMP